MGKLDHHGGVLVGRLRVSVLSPCDSVMEGQEKLVSHEACVGNGKEVLLPLKNLGVQISQAKQLLSSFSRILLIAFSLGMAFSHWG